MTWTTKVPKVVEVKGPLVWDQERMEGEELKTRDKQLFPGVLIKWATEKWSSR